MSNKLTGVKDEIYNFKMEISKLVEENIYLKTQLIDIKSKISQYDNILERTDLKYQEQINNYQKQLIKYNNYILPPNSRNYSSLTSVVNIKNVLKNKQTKELVSSSNNMDIISNNNIDLFIQNKIKNYNNSTSYNIRLDDLTKEFCKSVKSNNILMNNIYDDNKSIKNIINEINKD